MILARDHDTLSCQLSGHVTLKFTPRLAACHSAQSTCHMVPCWQDSCLLTEVAFLDRSGTHRPPGYYPHSTLMSHRSSHHGPVW